jgi:flagellar basal body-associated protein FliL
VKKILKLLLVVVPVVLVISAGVSYKVVFASNSKPPAPKVSGDLVPLTDEFVVNLAGGHYGKVSVALLLTKAPAGPSIGGKLEQNAVIRAVITDELTGLAPDVLIQRSSRRRLVARLGQALKEKTDEPIKEVLLTDIAVQ